MRKTSIKTLRNKADRLFHQVCLSQNPNCLICGKQAVCAHHYVPKSQSNNLRYDTKNGISICAGCHLRHHRAGDPRIAETIMEKMGKEWAEDLHARRRIICKFNKGYLKEVIEQLESQLDL